MLTLTAWIALAVIAAALLITWAVGITCTVTKYWPENYTPVGWLVWHWMLFVCAILVLLVGAR